MRTLVLCVDRDNDIGVKADVQGPVIGRKPNLDAAMTLALADPEDADVNTILAAVSMYDELVKGGIEAEVATITGDPRVGYQSDAILSQQLDEVLETVRPDNAYLVSDGAEDESIFPMIASRVKINHVKRVYVKQSPSVESAFYIAAKAMRDERLRRRIVLPIAISLVSLAIFLIVQPALVLPAVLFVLGVYLLVRAYEDVLGPRRVWEWMTTFYGNIKESLISGRVGVWFTLVAAITFFVAAFTAWETGQGFRNLPEDAVTAFGASFWIFILAALIHEGGRVAEAYFTKGKIARSFFYVALALFALILIIGAGIQFVSTLLGMENADTALTLVYIESALAISIVLVAAFLHRSSVREIAESDAWRP